MPKTVKLTAPITGQNGVKITEIVLRDPTYGDFVDLGMPATYVAVRDGGGFEQVTESVVQAWVERLCGEDPNYLYMLNLRDTLAIRGAVLDFFREAMAPLLPPTESAPSPAISSSDSA